MQECRDESDIYNYQRIQLSNNKFIMGAWGVRLTWLDGKKPWHTEQFWSGGGSGGGGGGGIGCFVFVAV